MGDGNDYTKGFEMTTDFEHQVAALCHEQWSGWMEYLFEQGVFNDDGTWTMPVWAVSRWMRQSQTKYGELSEEERENDLAEARKFFGLFWEKLK